MTDTPVDARTVPVPGVDFAAVRTYIAEQLNVAGVNVYAYPDPQVEYPALVLPIFDLVRLHASYFGGEVVTWRAEVLVAAPEPETGVADLEQLILTIAYALEALPDPAPYSSLVVHEVYNVRRREGQGAMSADLQLELHA